jgi:hypothetical protein
LWDLAGSTCCAPARPGREHRATTRKIWKKAGFELRIRLFTVDSLNQDGARTGGGRQPYSASEFETVYKIPIEFAMLEIINCIILVEGACSSFMQPREEAFEKGRNLFFTPKKGSKRPSGG